MNWRRCNWISTPRPANSTATANGWKTLRAAIAPTPLAFTALPTWLDSPAFARLIQAADVLRIASPFLRKRPALPGQRFTLCDPEQARRAIDKAGRFDRPFQVALPTCGYRAWFRRPKPADRPVGRRTGLDGGRYLPGARSPRRSDRHGRFGTRAATPPSRCAARGDLVPLPAEDRLSWNERTWQTVMQGKTPVAKTELMLEPSTDGLVEVAVRAAGDADSLLDAPVTLQWRQASLFAADGLAGFAVERVAPAAVRLQPPRGEPPRLAPGRRLTLGWLRFNQPPEISAHVEPQRLARALLGVMTLATPLEVADACGHFPIQPHPARRIRGCVAAPTLFHIQL
ncbi:MAG: DUF3142 domain-containing protein [Chromatiales bacterium]|nr:DUF3142 domain-containing protein [Chromatiales bacterium]